MSESKRRGEAPTEHVLRAFKEFRAAVFREPMRQTMKEMHRHNLSFAAIVTLMTLRDRGDASISELAGEVGLSVAATSQLVEKLLRDGLVRRTQSAADRRRKQAALTARGSAFVARLDGSNAAAAAKVLQSIPDATLRQLARALDGALGNLNGKQRKSEIPRLRSE
jgi:DNA-binding MarR family transcriptional regulator